MPKPRTAPIRLQVSVSEELDAAIKDFRFGQRFASESLALNALITLGLQAHESGWKPRPPRKSA